MSFKAIYLSNNHVAAVNSASLFKTVTCLSKIYKKPVTVNKLVARDVGDGTDDDEDMEIWYKIEFLGENDQVIDACENKKSNTYVEEPTKVGGENSSNTYFVNESPETVNKPIFKIKYCQIFDAVDFESVKLFKAWDRLDLYLTIK